MKRYHREPVEPLLDATLRPLTGPTALKLW